MCVLLHLALPKHFYFLMWLFYDIWNLTPMCLLCAMYHFKSILIHIFFFLHLSLQSGLFSRLLLWDLLLEGLRWYIKSQSHDILEIEGSINITLGRAYVLSKEKNSQKTSSKIIAHSVIPPTRNLRYSHSLYWPLISTCIVLRPFFLLKNLWICHIWVFLIEVIYTENSPFASVRCSGNSSICSVGQLSLFCTPRAFSSSQEETACGTAPLSVLPHCQVRETSIFLLGVFHIHKIIWYVAFWDWFLSAYVIL